MGCSIHLLYICASTPDGLKLLMYCLLSSRLQLDADLCLQVHIKAQCAGRFSTLLYKRWLMCLFSWMWGLVSAVVCVISGQSNLTKGHHCCTWMVYMILYSGSPLPPFKIAPSHGDLDPIEYMVPLAHPCPQPKGNLDRFSHFCRACDHDRQTALLHLL